MNAMKAGPAGGLHAGRIRRRWGWSGTRELVSRPIRCQRETCYLARAQQPHGGTPHRLLLVDFLRDGHWLESRCLRLDPNAGAAGELIGWVTSPADATHLRLHVPACESTSALLALTLHPVAALDPICHPLANVPPWNTYQMPLALSRLLLPRELEALATHLEWLPVEVLGTPRSKAHLGRLARGSACIVGTEWVDRLRLRLADVESLAAAGWIIVDTASLARLIGAACGERLSVTTHTSRNGIMSARVEYADVPTRGLALQDVIPYTLIDRRGRFAMRAIRNSHGWRRQSADAGWVTLLSLETPWEQERRDVLSVMRGVGNGRLLATDLPWLVAGAYGPLLAPRIAAHLLRMHLGGPVADHVQYWNRWAAPQELVRDIADLPSRYPRLRTMRWVGADPAVAHLGISLPAAGAERHLLVSTGRIDDAGRHGGLPAQPMMIFMKWLACQWERGVPWALRHLSRCRVTWQFDTTMGLKYAAEFEAADDPPRPDPRIVRLRVADGPSGVSPGGDTLVLPANDGPHGDGSLAWLDELTRHLLPLIEGCQSVTEKRFASSAR